MWPAGRTLPWPEIDRERETEIKWMNLNKLKLKERLDAMHPIPICA